jgi:hypothetical protein
VTETIVESSVASEQPKNGWRLKIGTWMFTIPFVMFFGAPIVIPLLGLSAGQATALIGGIIVAAEVIWFASIPLLGLQGFKAMKKKAFGFLKLKVGPISQSRHKLGVRLFWFGLGGQLLLHAIMIIAYAIVGAHPERTILGLTFEQQLAVYFSLLIVFVLCLIAGIYALGAQFADRFKQAFDWSEHLGDVS